VIYFTFNLETLWYQAPNNKQQFPFRKGVIMAFGAWLSAAKLAAAQGEVGPTGACEARMKILYVEDNDDNAYMLKNRLTRAGFTVVVATDGAQGVAMAASERPDLILMDLTLPDIDGKEATRRIKADPATKRIPVIALTANAMTGDREKAIAAGCDDFDTKPVELERLLGKIGALALSASAP
jgi:two-component system cell cycle response regulator DivK